MIELTPEMSRALQTAAAPLRLVDPTTRQEFVVVPAAEFDRLTEYDDSPWTDEEMDLLADEAGSMLDAFGKTP